MSTYETHSTKATETRGPAILGIDHIQLYVANIYQAECFYRSVMGLRGMDRPCREGQRDDEVSVALGRQDIRLVLTAPLTSASPVGQHLHCHGEGVRDIALNVVGVDPLFERATRRGAKAVLEPTTIDGAHYSARIASISVCGDLVHTLVEHLDGTVPRPVSEPDTASPDTGLEAVDHVAIALGPGELDERVQCYVDALGFRETHQEDVSTDLSAMRSKVVEAPGGSVRFPLMEPAAGRRKSQIARYVECHEGPGAQHLAFRSNDIVASVSTLLGRGLQFLPTPRPYYDNLEARVGPLSSELAALRSLGILVDRDSTGLLLQVFTKPVGTRPTLFLEVIERRGAGGFGSGNIRALFEAVESAGA